MSIHFEQMSREDLSTFSLFIKNDIQWQMAECKRDDLEQYFEEYQKLGGEWRLWYESKPIAITYHLEHAPSNHKTWLGTIIVSPERRRQNHAKRVVKQLVNECKLKGEDVMFTAVPITNQEWMDFLGHCGFEQVKLEKDDEGNSYIIMAHPI